MKTNYKKLTKEQLIALLEKNDRQRVEAGKLRWKKKSKKQKSEHGKMMIKQRWENYKKKLSTVQIGNR